MPQGEHEVEFAEEEKEPGEQAVQFGALLDEKVPAGHMLQFVAPPAEKLPAGQIEQFIVPLLLL